MSGLIALVLLFSTIVIGVKASFGEFDNVYVLKASFVNAGQGLQKGSDIKIRGVNVGKVRGVRLVDGQALVTMEINHSTKVPTNATATVRAKTLFGEKFVDVAPGDGEGRGPYYKDGDLVDKCDKSKVPEKTCAIGGFELEQVLGDAYPLLAKINPTELFTVVDTLAQGGKDLGPAINRQIVNGQKVLDVMAAHDADTRQFLTDLATLSQQLGVRAQDLVSAANDLNVALPTLNDRADKLNTLLHQTARLSNDVADLLLNNKGFIDKSFSGGQQVLDTIYDRRNDLVPLVVGLREYLQTLTEVIRIPAGDGTLMGAVKSLTASDTCKVFVTACAPAASAAAGSTPANGAPAVGGVAPPALSDVTQLLLYLARLGGS
ncbi:MAG TPA: MlaD family protein [Acidimicrobiales bacterium]|nr:MlaD family protein [Acidimicrobiales bacterium]